MRVTLTRMVEVHGTTLGRLSTGLVHPPLWTLEEPWRDNKRSISCIPKGIYTAVPHGWKGEPVQKPRVWRLLDVPDRTGILMCHVGNTVDDTEGCGLVGLGMLITRKSAMLTDSVAAIEVMRELIGPRGFELVIE